MLSDMAREYRQKRQSFETGAVVLIFSTIIVKAIGVFFKIPISNFLGDEGYGCFASAYDLFTPFYAMAMSGLPVSMARLIAAYNALGRCGDIKQISKLSHRLFMGIGTVGFLIFTALVPWLSYLTDASGNTRYGLFAIAPSIFLFCLMSYYRGMYEGFSNMTPTAVSDLIEALGKLILGYGFARIAFKITHDIILSAAAALFGITVGVAFATLYIAIKYRVDGVNKRIDESSANSRHTDAKTVLKELVSVALPVTASAVAVSVFASFIDVLTVKSCLSNAGINDATLLYGLRSKAFTLYNLVPSITTVIGISAVPALSAAKVAGDKELLKNKTQLLLKITAVTAIPIGIGMSVFSKPIMKLLYSSHASGEIGAEMLSVYGFAAVFAGMSVVVIHALQALGMQKTVLISLIGGILLKLIINIILISNANIGILGAAYGTLIAYMVLFAVSLVLLIKASCIFNVLKIFVKPIIASLGCAAVCLLAHEVTSKAITLFVILAAAAVYFILIFALKTFSRGELESFFGREKA